MARNNAVEIPAGHHARVAPHLVLVRRRQPREPRAEPPRRPEQRAEERHGGRARRARVLLGRGQVEQQVGLDERARRRVQERDLAVLVPREEEWRDLGREARGARRAGEDCAARLSVRVLRGKRGRAHRL